MSEYKEGDRVLVDAVDGSTGFVEVEITALEYNYFNDLRYRAGKRILHPKEIQGHAQAPAQETDTDEPNERARILAESEKLINGDRAKDYGDPNENFGRIADLWNAQFAHKLNQPFTAQDVAYALIHLKMSRLANTPGHRDSLIDVCGYAALSGELK
ncbi:hypothetical protein ATC04_05690 [Arthrobacter sp. YC-RL1]|uniref:DUF6378 domain-containing protein n=1 Tax=Arthrobacter sp. YC-RL1 TaxID=1652545 RepID=UPI00069ABD00|nr:DUF6378 domain-containing protein [Arthrobacter sp. YC-RL1]ALQ30098.1 hypothetical protein ATC04_05690 [Arthrobacter sp. YC-RL1]